jgi:hypothetical protein
MQKVLEMSLIIIRSMSIAESPASTSMVFVWKLDFVDLVFTVLSATSSGWASS